jgi:hypothetical protein
MYNNNVGDSNVVKAIIPIYLFQVFFILVFSSDYQAQITNNISFISLYDEALKRRGKPLRGVSRLRRGKHHQLESLGGE